MFVQIPTWRFDYISTFCLSFVQIPIRMSAATSSLIFLPKTTPLMPLEATTTTRTTTTLSASTKSLSCSRRIPYRQSFRCELRLLYLLPSLFAMTLFFFHYPPLFSITPSLFHYSPLFHPARVTFSAFFLIVFYQLLSYTLSYTFSPSMFPMSSMPCALFSFPMSSGHFSSPLLFSPVFSRLLFCNFYFCILFLLIFSPSSSILSKSLPLYSSVYFVSVIFFSTRGASWAPISCSVILWGSYMILSM